jgi:hypothetical protein
MMVRKTAQKAFCRNAQDFSREEFTIPVFNCDGKGFFGSAIRRSSRP